jgi:hypothetical protein
VLSFAVLVQSNLAYSPAAPTLSHYISKICGLSASFCGLFTTPVVCFQQLAACPPASWRDSFPQHPGWVFLCDVQRALRPLTQSLEGCVVKFSVLKSFICRSYAGLAANPFIYRIYANRPGYGGHIHTVRHSNLAPSGWGCLTWLVVAVGSAAQFADDVADEVFGVAE